MAIVVTSVRSSALSCLFSALWMNQVEPLNSRLCLGSNFSTRKVCQLGKPVAYPFFNNAQISSFSRVYFSFDSNRTKRTAPTRTTVGKNMGKRSGKMQHHLWQKRDTAGSGQKAFNLVRIVSELPNEKAAVYGALDRWIAWELEFPLVAAAKGLQILKKRSQWARVIQVAKWMLSKGQGATMATYDTLLLAFDMEQRVDEAESLWNMILHTHTRSISKRLFSRMIALYNHHCKPEKLIEVFADMEELGVKPDEDTVRRISRAFQELGQEDKKKMVLKRYGLKWKYIHFNGERVRVKVDHSEYE